MAPVPWKEEDGSDRMTPERRKDDPALAGYSPPLLKPRGPVRWGLFVSLNLAAFAAANVFLLYLRSGTWLDVSPEAFRRDLTTPLGQVLLEPLNIFTHPWMILVLGLLLALLIAVPIVTAVMYPLLLAMVFVVMVAVLGHAPWLALALAAGCLLAARSRLRREYPFLAALMGLLPVGVYLYLLTYAGIDAALLLPLQRWVLAVPFVLATISAMTVMAIVVWMARLRKFQPGVFWPALLLLLPPTVAVFYTQVGPAELHYTLLMRSLAPRSALLAPIAREEWVRRHGEGLGEQRLFQAIRDDLTLRRNRLSRRCEDFLRRFPHSRRAPAVAWIDAQAQSLQLDQPSFEDQLISYTSAWPRESSAAAWRALLRAYPDSDQAALARWHLGVMAFRTIVGRDAEATLRQAVAVDKQLREARDQLRRIVALRRETALRNRPASVFSSLASLPTMPVYEQALFEAEKLTWWIERNDVLNDSRCAQALARWLCANPHRLRYAHTIQTLAADPAYAETSMADNLCMMRARLHEDPYDRAKAMLPLAADQRTDTAIEAHYELGRITMQSAHAQGISQVEGIRSPETYFKIVVAAPPNPWQQKALDHLQWLPPSASLPPEEP